MKSNRDIYFEINHRQAAIIDTTISGDNVEIFSASHLFVADLEKWMKYLNGFREGIMYRTAMEEYANALFLLASGLYRQAYITLRFFLEHMLFGLYLSVNEMNFRRWSMNRYDMHWSEITDEENGVFCRDFFEAFSPECSEYATELLGICKQLYRELSEYTHGNLLATQTLPADVQYNSDSFSDISRKIESIRYLITFLFFIRYNCILTGDAIDDLEHSVMDVIGTRPEVQAFFSTRQEE